MKKSHPAPSILLSQLNSHYDLSKAGKDVKLSVVHPTLQPDLLSFLEERGKRKLKKIKDLDLVPLADYKAWIKKIHNDGVGYVFLIKNDLTD